MQQCIASCINQCSFGKPTWKSVRNTFFQWSHLHLLPNLKPPISTPHIPHRWWFNKPLFDKSAIWISKLEKLLLLSLHILHIFHIGTKFLRLRTVSLRLSLCKHSLPPFIVICTKLSRKRDTNEKIDENIAIGCKVFVDFSAGVGVESAV